MIDAMEKNKARKVKQTTKKKRTQEVESEAAFSIKVVRKCLSKELTIKTERSEVGKH